MMEIVRTQGDEPCHLPLPQPVFLAIGVFDGVHLGHQRVIRHTIECAHLAAGIAAVYTFSPHPSCVVGTAKSLIFPLELKYERMASLGVDVVIEQRFDALFSQLSGEKFIQLLQKKIPTLRGICVGEDFKFGTFRSGDTHSLDVLAQKAHMELHILSSLRFRDDFRISSTRIRRAIADGHMGFTNDLLGMPYEIHGILLSNAGTEQGLGYPFRLHWQPELRPRAGLYYVYYESHATHDFTVKTGNGIWYYPDDVASDTLCRIYPLGEIELSPGDEIKIRCLHFARKLEGNSVQGIEKIISESDKKAAEEYFLQKSSHGH
jgi:riboflavin kinase/FMN adenylyltransferase